jgi:phenylacetate-CoA ligase
MAEREVGGNLIEWNTSGTTGTPLTFHFTEEAFQKTFAFLELYREGTGLSRNSRRAQFTGKPIIPASQNGSAGGFWRHDLANRTLLLSTTHLSYANLPAYCAAIANFRPDSISGYPSAIYLLAQAYAGASQRIPSLKAILTSAETLLSHQRGAIESAFNTKVYDQYGQSELQSFWYECSHGSMHMHPLAGVSEILLPDNSPARPGTYGEIVVTGFQNLAMPLLRYRIGDSARLSDKVCPCGRRMPVVGKIYGRLEDYVYTEDRGFVGRLDPAFKGVENIVESQIVQESLDLLQVFYVPAPEFSSNDLSCLERNLRDRVGKKIRLEFISVSSIPRGGGGKLRAVISKLPESIRAGLIENWRDTVACGRES